MDITLHNTATKKDEIFHPIKKGHVGMYHCGPTVYDYAHIGNLRAYVFADTLRRMFEASGYTVEQVINITDVGHIVADADVGEDKMEVGAKREGKSVEDIIRLYTDAYKEDLRALNILTPQHFPRATENIPEQIAMITTLEKKGHTYKTSDGIYFDASTFPRYAEFARLNLEGQKGGARVEENNEKRNAYDFALWKFSGKEERLQEWESPWGKGFPGWHIECSAMSQKILGETFDVHTGGIDHIPVHHTNEIAQSECATGKKFVNYWMHSGFMTVEGEKMSKSLGNTYRLSDLEESDVSAVALRYWFLTAKYDTQINFTWETIKEMEQKIWGYAYMIAFDATPNPEVNKETINHAIGLLQDDLHTPFVIALIDKIGARDTKTLEKLLDLLGIDITKHKEALLRMPPNIIALVGDRDLARVEKNWPVSDNIRKKLESFGYIVEDTPGGTRVSRRSLV